jgi:2-C-methyl-D-erythritol 4-phosphate cytidylyltransferase
LLLLASWLLSLDVVVSFSVFSDKIIIAPVGRIISSRTAVVTVAALSSSSSSVVVRTATAATAAVSTRLLASAGGAAGASSDPEGEQEDVDDAIDMADVGFVLLAGGTGSRMKANLPKQFLTLRGAPVLHHSLDLFLERLPAYLTSCNKSPPPFVVLVMDPTFQPDYQAIVNRYHPRLAFANPGVERQGSVENGLQKLVDISNGTATYVAIHDSARPLVTIAEVCHVVRDAKQVGTAAVLGVPCKATIKESADDGQTVLRTIPRARLWEVHTPQVVRTALLQRGFAKVAAEQLEVTDDVSIVEALGETVRLTLGEYTNLKITTPEDMDVAEAILQDRKSPRVNMLQETMAKQ